MKPELRIALFADIDGYKSILPAIKHDLVLWVVAQTPPSLDALNPACHVIRQPPRNTDAFESFVADFRTFGIDVIISCSYSRLIPEQIVALAKLDAINVHGGLLPEYRGANVLNWVLIEGRQTTGVTVHELSPGFDEGDILIRQEIPISDVDDALSLRTRLSTLIPDAIRTLVHQWKMGDRPPRLPQDESKAAHYRRRTAEDGLFDWTWSDLDIFNLVRALVSPWPGAFFYDTSGTKHTLREYHTMGQIRDLRRQFGDDSPVTTSHC